MMNIITQMARFFIGALFIFSGLLKLNDPIGFSYKLEEYFTVFGFNSLVPLAFWIGLFLLFLEVLLGVLILIGYRKKFTLWSLLILIVFFTALTFYSAFTGKVTDCGCFGDAIKLTPWESFSKDVVLLVLIIWLMIYQKYIKPLLSNKTLQFITYLTLLICFGITYYVMNYLPIKDFRAYKVGTNIIEGMTIPEGAPQPKYDMVFIYKVNGVVTEFSYDDVMAEKVPENAEFVDRTQKLIEPGYQPPIKDFKMEFKGVDYTTQVMSEPKIIMVTSFDLQKASPEALKLLKDLHEKSMANDYIVVGLTGSSEEVISKLTKEYDIPFDFFFCDPTAVKTIERANPSIVHLEYGTIKSKLHWKWMTRKM
jgi:uncharacterized membrane protein YphA (DoxX/SURF4 family)